MINKRIYLILLLAFFLRLAFVLSLDDSTLFGPDAEVYDILAMRIVKGESFQFTGYFDKNFYSFRPPLFPLFLSLVYSLFGHSFLAARLALVLISTLTCVIIYKLAVQIFNEKVGMISTLLMAIYPKFVYYSGSLSTETLFIFLLALTMFYLFKSYQHPGVRNLILGGLFFGLASLTRSVIFAFLVFIILWRLFLFRNKSRAIRDFLIVSFAALLIMSPWIVRNYFVHRAFVPTTTEGGYTLWLGNNPLATGGGAVFLPEDKGQFEGLSEVQTERLFYRLAFDFMKNNPRKFILLLENKFIRFWRFYPHSEYVERKYVIIGGLSFSIILFLSLAGVFSSGGRWKEFSLFYLLFFYYTIIHMFFATVTRHRVPIMPYLIIFAAEGILRIKEKTLNKRRPDAAPENILQYRKV